ncbi:MAG: hypothetical protein AB1742_02095 [bacterium]
MKRFLKTALLLSAALALPAALITPAWAKTKSPFTPRGVRPQGMGNAFVAVAGDINSIYWNPAGLALIKRGESQLMIEHQDLYGFGVDENYVAFAQNKFGFSWRHTGVGADFLFGADWSENVFTLSYAHQMDPQLYAGASLKYLKQTFKAPTDATTKGSSAMDVNGDGYAADVGFLYVVSKDTTAGVAVRDIFGEAEAEGIPGGYKDRYEPIVSFGFSRTPSENIIHSFQLDHVAEEWRVSLGVEYKLQREIILRAGLEDEVITAGLGLMYEDWEIDYSFKNKPSQGLDKTQRFGAIVRF